MSDLTVITVVENDQGTLDLMVRSVLRFTDFTPKFIICCNNEKESINIRALYKEKDFIKIINNKPELGGGSNRHGSGVSAAFELVDTENTTVIESDCAVVRDNWYKTDKTLMAAKKGPGLYHICFAVFKTEALKGIDFRPGNLKNRANRSYMPFEDVGWQISKYVKQQDIEELELIDCKTKRGEFFDGTFQSDEIIKNNKTIVVHCGRGSNISGKAIRKGFISPQKQFEKWKEKVIKIIRYDY